MSEYQYYEFRAVDRPLTQGERDDLRAISTRAEITATSFSNEYNWGDLKASPHVLVERYFDAHFYLANWGSRTLMFRFPEEVVGTDAVDPYAIDDAVHVWSSDSHTLLGIYMGLDDSYYEDEWWAHQNALGDLIELRDQIMGGDYRCLYIAWLNQAARLVDYGEPSDDFADVPIPPGLGSRNAALERFASVFALDRDLIDAAAAHSEPIGEWEDARRRALETFVATLPADLKDELLLRVARQEAGVGLELMSRFHQSGTAPGAEATSTPSPSLEELIDEAERVKSERERQVRIRRARKAAARKKAEDERRQRRLDDLADDWDHHWQRVFEAIDERQRRAYRRAAALMAELGEAARNPAQTREFGEHVRTLRDEYANRPALMQEMDNAGLPGEQ